MPRRSRLAKLGIASAALVLLAFAGLAVWWPLGGEAFLYRVIFPDDAALLAGHEISRELSAEAFRSDLAFLERELPRLHVDFDRAFDRRALADRTARLVAAADRWSSDRRRLELVGHLASGGPGTGHTMILPLQRPLGWRIYPLATFLFADGLYVTAAAAPWEAAVGGRVEAIGGVPTAEALERLRPYVPSDNRWSADHNLSLLLGLAEPLVELGLAADDGILRLKLAGGLATAVAVEPVPFASLAGLAWGRRAYARVDEAWSPADGRPRSRPFTLDRRPDPATLYLRIDEVRNAADESLAELATRLDRVASERPVERFVVDLRSNSGGHNHLVGPLVEAISDHPVLDRRDVLYVLIGRRTFSAASALAGALERRTRALFVGEPSGFATEHYGDARAVLLPASKVVVRLASRRWREDLPGAGRRAIEPDLPLPFEARHHFDDADPAIERIREHQRRGDGPEVGAGDGGQAVATDVAPPPLGVYLLSPHHRVRIFRARGMGPDSGLPGEVAAAIAGGTAADYRLAIDALGVFARTDLHGPGPEWITDIRDVLLEAPAGSPPILRWKGVDFPLEPADPGHRLPIELVQAGEVEAGVAAFRAAGGDGLDAGWELALDPLGYRLIEADRSAEAVRVFTLMTELFPQSANSWASLGDGLRAAGELDLAAANYRRSLDLDPLFDYSRRRLDELDAEQRVESQR